MRKIMITTLSAALVTMSLPAEAVAGPLYGNAMHDNAFDQPGAGQPGAKLEYDSANRLRRMKRGNLDIRYVYDGLGNLEAEIVDDGQKVTRTDLMLDESAPLPRVIGALTDDGAHELYAYGPMGVAMVRKNAAGQPPATYYALTDELGTVRGLADGTGALAGRVAYGPFGRMRVTEGEQTRLAFAGEYRDMAGLIWLRARHYAPFLGRFLQRDTVVDDPGNPQTLNRYGYAANNPLSNLDPSGHFIVETAVLTAAFLLITWCQAALAPSGDPNEPGLAEAQKHNSEIYQRTAIDGTLGVVMGPLANSAGSWAGRTLLTSGLADDAARGAYISANGGRVIMGPGGALGTVGASSARANRAQAAIGPMIDDVWNQSGGFGGVMKTPPSAKRTGTGGDCVVCSFSEHYGMTPGQFIEMAPTLKPVPGGVTNEVINDLMTQIGLGTSKTYPDLPTFGKSVMARFREGKLADGTGFVVGGKGSKCSHAIYMQMRDGRLRAVDKQAGINAATFIDNTDIVKVWELPPVEP